MFVIIGYWFEPWSGIGLCHILPLLNPFSSDKTTGMFTAHSAVLDTSFEVTSCYFCKTSVVSHPSP